jgi:hypothetical protein
MRGRTKSWRSPEVIVLTRGRAEEAVLLYCKMVGASGQPLAQATGCKSRAGRCDSDCSTVGTS